MRPKIEAKILAAALRLFAANGYDRTTIRDIARAAGVHVSTVSRVINSSGDVAVRPETRQRILDAARELQYRPNAIARGLKLAVTGTLGLLVPSLRNPVNSPIMRDSRSKLAMSPSFSARAAHIPPALCFLRREITAVEGCG